MDRKTMNQSRTPQEILNRMDLQKLRALKRLKKADEIAEMFRRCVPGFKEARELGAGTASVKGKNT
ncbi:MAG: hypothetical protein M0P13_10955 [Fibrobacteraceae bacterium]|nr:hypothetical protein [Fibrobacteraceae bacterium]